MTKKSSVKGYVPSDNYCTMSPDGLFGVRFNYACYLHDRQYRNEVKTRLSRKAADQAFRVNIYNEYVKKGKRKIGLIVSWIYYLAVRIGSRRFWK